METKYQNDDQMETKYQNDDKVLTKKQDGDIQLEIEQINKTTMKKKKVSRGMHMFSVVMFMLRRRRRRKAFHTGFWRRAVETVRRVRSESTIMPSSNFINTIVLPPAPPLPSTETRGDGGAGVDDVGDSGERLTEATEVFTAASSSSSSGISGYGSAMSLRDLDYPYDDDIDEEDEYYSDVEGGDDMIDEKAEEFIVRFYEQMKMQNQDYTDRCKAKGIMMN
ncbi:hypothetical protein CARUB_v10011230mg [Capsella rubella]|uniref:Uncharacterized protein n=1 Tax=Capsella rubella TaxID=81985 RepID=R0IK39_9BRAS|nr:uncharacterized protein LOC17898899 [Capsella rubella]EOA38865.1 hypothetical protein CARUB_v10011230mg [Capsella rubella]